MPLWPQHYNELRAGSHLSLQQLPKALRDDPLCFAPVLAVLSRRGALPTGPEIAEVFRPNVGMFGLPPGDSMFLASLTDSSFP